MLLRDRMAHLIAQQWPGAQIVSANPLFDYESRRVAAPKLEKFYAPLATVLFIFVIIGYRASIISRGSIFSWLLLAISLFMSVLCDLRYLALTVNSVGQQIESGQWDLLRLTELRPDDILTAKFAVSQMRAWRWMAADIALRLAVVAFGLGQIVLWIAPPINNFNPPRSVPVILAFYAIFASVYALEPLWRMRAFVAVGIAVSARVQSQSFAMLAGFAVLVGLRLIQGVILIAVGLFALPMAFYLSRWYIIPRSLDLMNVLVYFLVCLLSAGLVYAFYKILEESALRRALTFAFRTE